MLKKYSLSKAILGSHFLSEGLISQADGNYAKAFEGELLSCGKLEESFDGSTSDSYFTKLSDLFSKLPNLFNCHIVVRRCESQDREINGFTTNIYFFETVKKPESYSHIQALLSEVGIKTRPMTSNSWDGLLKGYFGNSGGVDRLPDLLWERDHLKVDSSVIRAVSLTELPQVTWKGCLQAVFENPYPFTLSLKFSIPDRSKIKRQLETRRRVSHALSITNSLEVRNIESNSVLHSAEETLERILLHKETLFEMSCAVILSGSDEATKTVANDLERIISGVGNAGLFTESLGVLPVVKSHLPGNKVLDVRKLPILSGNLVHLLPFLHDFTRSNDPSSLPLLSRSGEICNLNLFSKENLNFNSFICGASGSGKSFLMNAILSSVLTDDPKSRICIFDVGGSYRRIIEANGGSSTKLTYEEARALISTFLRAVPANPHGFFRAFLETLCGSGSHITHSHLVAMDDLIKAVEGTRLEIRKIITLAQSRSERFYLDIAHWLKPHVDFDDIPERPDLMEKIKDPVSAFDFKDLDSDPVLQKTTILLLTEILWRDLVNGRFTRTLIVFDEVWRFFSQSKSFLEEMYRTLRKYKAGIVSITQNLADYGDETFAKMLFTNSFTKIFLQNGASADYLRETFDLPSSDISRALSVTSKKPLYSEFFGLSPTISQVFRLYPTKQFYDLANTENIAITNRKDN